MKKLNATLAGRKPRDDAGVVREGARADLVVFDVADYRAVPYFFGENHARVVIKSGRVVCAA